ncbi:N-(5'-phosphoribosyl)anthranilate isomerase [Novosphingobium fuchskuhlense]|uniref:N-(5'-phosphoribosyl)anthranilate isomerase n=1 Tax=Novosphingobium fuchskuhlense TaxID=1117702 RepID=A0A117UTI2_9SPHN|nr:phosphoribosylanthranilate isomerase [Novosphingobium fuchskuhlense]KUR70542.1 N-(5'-phosphoribosyl)anthranilate isomerase [Novosphingobium fuchskuhlense]
MPAPEIKICGLTSPAALEAAIAARADYAGLVIFPPSPRHLALADAAALAARAAGRIKLVGLFVDAAESLVAEVVAAASLDVIQLHGKEDPARVAAIRAAFGKPVWKATAVSARDDITRAETFAGAADLVLFDAKPPKGAAMPGGLGLVFDWTLLAGYKAPLPWGLAGGLSPANVAEAVRVTKAPLVDVSSGVESAPGVKDEALIKQFCREARAI